MSDTEEETLDPVVDGVVSIVSIALNHDQWNVGVIVYDDLLR